MDYVTYLPANDTLPWKGADPGYVTDFWILGPHRISEIVEATDLKWYVGGVREALAYGRQITPKGGAAGWRVGFGILLWNVWS